MIQHDYRQGNGNVHTFTGTAPTERADGSPLAAGDIDHYVREVDGPLGIEYMDVYLTAGSFSEPVAIDVLQPGTYTYRYQTVDSGGRISVPSEQVVLEVLAPFALPNPPLMLG